MRFRNSFAPTFLSLHPSAIAWWVPMDSFQPCDWLTDAIVFDFKDVFCFWSRMYVVWTRGTFFLKSRF